MPDKKLTDSEIKKALECCNTEYDEYQCPHCPLLHKGCKKALIQNALDLINRLQEENEELKEAVKVLRVGVEQAHLIRKDGKSPFNLLKAEIKAEAYKECIEKAKNEIDRQSHSRSLEASKERFRILLILDNLLKELEKKENK